MLKTHLLNSQKQPYLCFLVYFLNYFSLFVSLGALLFGLWALAVKKIHKEVKFLLYCLIIISVRSILPGIHNLHWVNCFSMWLWPFTVIFMSVSISLGYFFYRYFNFLFYPLNKPPESLWHFLPSVIILLNLVFSTLFKSDIVLQINFYETWFQMDLFVPTKIMLLMFISTFSFYLIKIGTDLYRNFSMLQNHFDGFKFLLILIVFVLVVFIGILGFDLIDKVVFDVDSDNIALKIILVKPLFILFNFYLFYRYPALLLFGSYNEIQTLGIKHWFLKPRSKDVVRPHEKFHSIEVVRNLILDIEAVIKEGEVFRNQKYGLSELALEMQIPLGHLRFLFQEYCELSFVEYRNYQRVEDFKRCAQHKLENQNLTIEAIGSKCGFGSMNSLNRSVKKYENCTPGDLWQRSK